MSEIRVEEAHGADSLNSLRAEWQELFIASCSPPFLSWEWITSWQQWLNRNGTPCLLCAREGRKLVGLLPLSVEERRLPGLSAKSRRLSFLGAGFGEADYLDLLLLPERAQEAAAAIFDYLARRVHFDILELDGLASDSPSLPLLARRFGQEPGFRYSVTPRFICPQVELDGDWMAILKRSRRGRNFKQRLQQFLARDGFEYRAVTRPEESKAAFERFLKLHESRWNSRGGSEVTGHELLRSFHRDLVWRMAENGLIRFDELWCEGACRASIYGLDDGLRYCCYSTGFDPDWKNASPGLALFGLSIENAIKRGVKQYDFLRGAEDYKFDWATTARETVSALIARRNLPAMLFTARQQTRVAARAVAKALLPEQAIELMRQRLRSRRREICLDQNLNNKNSCGLPDLALKVLHRTRRQSD